MRPAQAMPATTKVALVASLASQIMCASAAGECRTHDFPMEPLQKLNNASQWAVSVPPPPASWCYPDNFDKKLCKDTRDGWLSHEFHANDPVSVRYHQFTKNSCLLPDDKRPEQKCTRDGYPSFVFDARETNHIVQGVNFARDNNVRLTLKNTGHDYLGRSTAPKSLSLWTHMMKNITVNTGDFKPYKCDVTIEGPSVTVGAGVQMVDLYEKLAEVGRTFVGGNGKTVGVVGFTLGGGHSPLSNMYGLGVDQVLELEVVLADGSVVKANECENSDLFWAMRGGGGFTYGIVSSMTIKTHPMPKITAAMVTLAATPNTETNIKSTALFWSLLPELAEKYGVAGYMMSSGFMFDPRDPSRRFGGTTASLTITNSTDTEKLKEAAKFILNKAHAEKLPVMMPEVEPAVYDTVLGYINSVPMPSSPYTNRYIGSRIMSAEKLASPAGRGLLEEAARRSFNDKVPFQGVGALVVGGKGMREAKPRGEGVSAHPGWRTATASLFYSAGFAPFDAAGEDAALKKINEVLEPLRKLDPTSGAYSNEATPAEPDWLTAYWSDNVQRLTQIKAKYDPNGVFWCSRCIGNDKWEEKGDKLCRK